MKPFDDEWCDKCLNGPYPPEVRVVEMSVPFAVELVTELKRRGQAVMSLDAQNAELSRQADELRREVVRLRAHAEAMAYELADATFVLHNEYGSERESEFVIAYRREYPEERR